MDDDSEGEIPFEPVPSRTGRRDGWTEAAQRSFIAALARCGSVSAAARHAGRSASSAYRLRERDGAVSFAAAWDLAVEQGRDRMRDCVIDRAMNGGWVPVVRRGRIVRMEFRYFDRLAIAVLSGREAALAAAAEDRAEASAIRRRQRAEARRAAETETRRLRLADEGRREEAAPRPRAPPRITFL